MSYSKQVRRWKSADASRKIFILVVGFFFYLVVPFVVIYGAYLLGKSTIQTETKLAVRQYLRENLHDPQFQEIKWGIETTWNTGTLIKLKYRCRNQYNAWQLNDDLFLITKKSVRIVDPSESEIWELYRLSTSLDKSAPSVEQ